MMPGEKGQIRRFAHQLAHRSKEQEALENLMEKLNRAKSNLGLSLHVAHVGVTRVVGDSFAVNLDILNRIDTLLRNVFGEDGGLIIADLVKNRPLEDDGFVHIDRVDLSPRTTDKNMEQEKSKHEGLVSSRIVLKNVTKEQALQINGPVGEKGWREVFQLEIRDNQAAGSGIQVNHAVSEDVFHMLLAHNDRGNLSSAGSSMQIIAALVLGLVIAVVVCLK